MSLRHWEMVRKVLVPGWAPGRASGRALPPRAAGFLQGMAVPLMHAALVGRKAFGMQGLFQVTLRVSHVLLFYAVPLQQLSRPPALASTHLPDLCARGCVVTSLQPSSVSYPSEVTCELIDTECPQASDYQ